jgi:hypothetical protein
MTAFLIFPHPFQFCPDRNSQGIEASFNPEATIWSLTPFV